MLLLTAVTFGGQDSVGIFEHLPDDECELLRHRAAEILKIPRDKRIPLLVQEIKRLVTARRGGQVWAADPERLARVLGRERPALVEVVLRALPIGTAEAVRKHLPPGSEKVKLVREVKPQILHLIRWKLEEAVASAGPRAPGFKFSDLLLLKSREILTVCDRLGARSLAQAIAGLPAPAREEFLNRLHPDQRQLAARAATAAAARALNEEDARTLLAVHGGDKEPPDAIRSAGAQRLARACLAQSPEFAARVVERHPGPFSQLLVRWIREERPRVTGRIDGGRADVVAELDRLEQKGVIDRPVRLPPPPRAEIPPPHRGPLPGGRVLVPAPRPGPSSPAPGQRTPSPPDRQKAGLHRPPSRQDVRAAPKPPEPEQPWRDPIAARQARRAGLPVARAPEEHRRDPIAEREARRAGVGRADPEPREPREPRQAPAESSRRGEAQQASGRGPSRLGRPRANLEGKVVKARPGERPAPEEGELATAPGNIRKATVDRPPAAGDRTSLQRSPRPERPGGRGPRDGSG
jgi:hypothetical protein